ncbi:Ig-like domain repeat protein [Agromyces sp. CF514]|uniref:Ig-like domain repeat protein n=1 Tax=Agromyces sp. CF514 TaxID=1881031 RepID=UPI001160CB95|nr:Ig-like domain repeat protein [Agromyces sp. CF514]
MSGAVSAVTVTLTGLTHGALNDVDALLVAPTGDNLIVLSDIGDPNQLATASNADFTFSDGAASNVPPQVNVPSGTYKPTDVDPGGAADAFPAPAPAPSTQTTFAGAFSGIAPNGSWRLFVVDDATGDIGSISGGWSLTLTTTAADVATTTVITTSATPSQTGAPVTFTATVAAAGGPVTAGSVQFSDGVTNLGAPVVLNGSGQASLTTSALAEGTHQIRAVYSGATGFLTSNGALAQRVDNVTVVTGNTYCNTGVITVPMVGTASPYPSNVSVTGLTSAVTKVTVALKGVSHTSPVDLDILLSGPVPTTNAVLMSDTGGTTPISSVDLTFDDAAASLVGSAPATGSYRPTDVEPGDSFPAPAPAASGATALSVFAGGSSNGTWSLWVVDDATGDAGSVSGGWCLTIETQVATTTAVTSSANPSTVGTGVTFTAAVTAGGAPVTAGTVQFSDGATPLGGPVAVAADGTATLTTSALAAGVHPISAEYGGSPAFGASSGSLTQTVGTLATATTLTAAPDPSTVGDSVTLTATVVAGGAPASAGTVQFSDGATPLGGPVAVAADGTATLTTSTLAIGSHALTAAYGGTAALGGSSGSTTLEVLPVVDAGGPYAVAEGAGLSLDGSGSTPGAAYAWDVNGDGDFSDATGTSPTLAWAQLEELGIDDGPTTVPLSLRVTVDGVSATAATTLDVTNTAPTAVNTGSLDAIAGTPFTTKVGADDPSSADLAAMFTYTIDWGDGSPVETVTGPADPPVTHTYSTEGTFAAAFTVEDKDGGRSSVTTVNVRVAPAAVTPTPTPTPTPEPAPTPSPTQPPLAVTGGTVSAVPALLGALAVLAGVAALFLERRRRAS